MGCASQRAGCGLMADTRQFNVRVPEDAREVLSRLVARLKEDAGFKARIEAWLDSIEDGTAGDTLAERVARIEARLDALGAAPDRALPPEGTPPGNPSKSGQIPPGSPLKSEDTPQDTPALTIGEGRGRRLTVAGEIEVERRVAAGEDVTTISEALGVSKGTVRARVKKIERRLI